MEVTPGMNNIISKVHIVIPALKYDHEYTTHIELEVSSLLLRTQNQRLLKTKLNKMII